jgi:hypothetical protein
MDSIREVLIKDWDPVRVGDNEKLRDEYDRHIAVVYRLLNDGASETEIADRLFKIEHDLGMLAKSKDHLAAIVRKLKALNVKIVPDAA